MNTNKEKHKNNPLSDDKSEMLSFNSELNDKLSKELNANEEGDDYPLEVHEDEKLYSFYYNITENLSEYPIDFTTSDLTTRLYKKLCRALSSAMFR